LGFVVAAIVKVTPKAAAISVKTISAIAFEVRSRVILLFFLVLVKLILTC
jgi:hypothetical protein